MNKEHVDILQEFCRRHPHIPYDRAKNIVQQIANPIIIETEEDIIKVLSKHRSPISPDARIQKRDFPYASPNYKNQFIDDHTYEDDEKL